MFGGVIYNVVTPFHSYSIQREGETLWYDPKYDMSNTDLSTLLDEIHAMDCDYEHYCESLGI